MNCGPEKDIGEPLIGVNLKPEEVKAAEERMRPRVAKLLDDIQQIACSIVWFKTKDASFKEAEKELVAALHKVRNANGLLNDPSKK